MEISKETVLVFQELFDNAFDMSVPLKRTLNIIKDVVDYKYCIIFEKTSGYSVWAANGIDIEKDNTFDLSEELFDDSKALYIDKRQNILDTTVEHILTVPIDLLSNRWGSLLIVGDRPYTPDDMINLEFILKVITNVVSIGSLKKWHDVLKNAGSENYTQFVNSINHVLRTPLNGILGMTELLGKTKLDTEQKGYLKVVYGCCYELLYIVNNMLDFINIITHNIIFTMKSFNLMNCLEESVKFLSLHAVENNVSVEIKIKDSLNTPIISDEKRIRQILINLLSNAIKYTNRGKVTVEAKIENNQLYLQVSDTGIGISPERLDTIFEPFNQLVKHSDKDGVGLGLSICFNLAKGLKGKMWVKSKLGRGSTFYLTIPVKISTDKLTSIKDVEIVKGKHILIVDEGSANRTLLYKQMLSIKAIPKMCSSIEECLIILENEEIDVMLIHTKLVSSADIDILKKSKRWRKSIKIIGMSATDILGTELVQYDDVIRKPVVEVKLQRSIIKLLHSISTKPIRKLHMNILYAEDSKMNREITVSMLEQMGFMDVDTVNDGGAALAQIKKKEYDVILLDIKMPVLDGYGVTKHIVKTYSEKGIEKPVIVGVSAVASDINKKFCFSIGIDLFIEKPLIYEEFETMMLTIYDKLKN